MVHDRGHFLWCVRHKGKCACASSEVVLTFKTKRSQIFIVELLTLTE
jgi:hypothetical protein